MCSMWFQQQTAVISYTTLTGWSLQHRYIVFTVRYLCCCCQHLTLAFSLAHLQMFLSSADPLHPLIFNSNKQSHLISFSHLRRGLPTGPLPWYFPISTSVGLLVLSIRTVWPAHRYLLHATRNKRHYISVYGCSLRLGLRPTAFPWTGPNILLSTLPASSHCPGTQPVTLTLNLPTTTIVAQPFNVIKWQLKFNPVA